MAFDGRSLTSVRPSDPRRATKTTALGKTRSSGRTTSTTTASTRWRGVRPTRGCLRRRRTTGTSSSTSSRKTKSTRSCCDAVSTFEIWLAKTLYRFCAMVATIERRLARVLPPNPIRDGRKRVAIGRGGALDELNRVLQIGKLERLVVVAEERRVAVYSGASRKG